VNYGVVVSPDTERDLDQLFRFVARDNPAGARLPSAGGGMR
jgi:plasmid stabilization system protein ParE